jgi:hypothetical protein
VPEVRLSFAQRTDAQERVEQILDKAKDGEWAGQMYKQALVRHNIGKVWELGYRG